MYKIKTIGGLGASSRQYGKVYIVSLCYISYMPTSVFRSKLFNTFRQVLVEVMFTCNAWLTQSVIIETQHTGVSSNLVNKWF